MTSEVQFHVLTVLDNIKTMVSENIDDAQMFSDALEDMLNELQSNDAFGTEGQNDPRGDFRNQIWSMDCVECIDD